MTRTACVVPGVRVGWVVTAMMIATQLDIAKQINNPVQAEPPSMDGAHE